MKKLKALRQWLAALKRIVRTYPSDNKLIHQRISDLEKVLRERTEIAADINYRGHNHVIVIGKYRNRDFVQTYSIPADRFDQLIAVLQEENRYGEITRIDAPVGMRTAVMERV